MAYPGAPGGGSTGPLPALGSALPTLARLPQCAQGAAFGITAGFLNGTCADMICVCVEKGFFLVTAVNGATAKSCNASDQTLTTALLRRMCSDLVPSLNDYRGHELIGFYTFAITVAWLAVAMRLMSQRISRAKLSLDDYLVIVALIFDSVVNFAQLYSVHFGAGKHLIMVSAKQLTEFTKLSFISQIAFSISITTAKLSIVFLYHRLFRAHRFTTIGIVLAVFLIGWSIAFPLTVIFNCKPIAYFWDKSIPGGHCIDAKAQSYTLASISTATDVVVWALPIPWLWGLQMSVGKRLGIIAAFALGGFVCIAGVVRIVFLNRLVFTDITWTVVPLDIWINVESSIGIVCICLPRMRPLLSTMVPAGWRAFLCGSQVGSKESYTLTDQSNIRGRLRRIPSTASLNGVTPTDNLPPPGSISKNGFVRQDLNYHGSGEGNIDPISPASKLDHDIDVAHLPRSKGYA